MLLSKIEQNLERLLKDALNFSDIKLLSKWIKIICPLLTKEIKLNNPERVNKIYNLILDLAENLISLLESDDGEETLYLGPILFDVLIKVKSSIEEYDLYIEKNITEKNEPILKLSEEQIKSLEKLKNLSPYLF